MEATQNPTAQLFTWKRFIILGAVAMILSLSLFMSILAPLPLALAVLFYGRTKGSALVLAGLFGFWLLGYSVAQDYSAVVIFGYVSLMAFIIAEVATRKIRPSYSLVKIGASIFLLAMISLGVWLSMQDQPALEFVETQIVIPNVKEINSQLDKVVAPASPGRQDVVALLSNTKFLTREVFTNFPFMVFAFVMLTLWLNSYLLLKGRRLLTGTQEVRFSEFDLLSFRMPDQFVFLVIASLVLILYGENLGWVNGEIYGMMTLKCLAVLYFLHGLGVMIQVLSFWKIRGFLRIVIVALVIGIANWILSAIGLLDTWFDFRRKVVLGFKDKDLDK